MPISNANNGTPRLQCTAEFHLAPAHDAARARAALEDVALTSTYVALDEPIAVMVQERPWGTHYRLRAYPMDARQQFRFLSDLSVRGKAELLRLGMTLVSAPTMADMQQG
jgi:hypothetical protein